MNDSDASLDAKARLAVTRAELHEEMDQRPLQEYGKKHPGLLVACSAGAGAGALLVLLKPWHRRRRTFNGSGRGPTA